MKELTFFLFLQGFWTEIFLLKSAGLPVIRTLYVINPVLNCTLFSWESKEFIEFWHNVGKPGMLGYYPPPPHPHPPPPPV